MINKWILDNFKSIESREELEFRPLTIFTGANSSGKSTILQSVLLISQTLQNPIDSRSIVLNGGIKKFGSYSDVVNRRDFKKKLTIGFDITDDMMGYKRFNTPWMDGVKNVVCKFVLGAKKDNDLQPFVQSLSIDCLDRVNHKASLNIARSENSEAKRKYLKESKQLSPIAEMEYDASLSIDDGFSRMRYEGREMDNNYIGASFTHFLPQFLMYCYNRYKRASDRLFDRLIITSSSIRYWGLDEDESNALSHALKPISLEILEKIKSAESSLGEKSKMRFDEMYERYQNDPRIELLVELIQLSGMREGKREELLESIKKAITQLSPSYDVDRVHSHIIPGIDFIKEFFCGHIWYLGPLREEPKAIYPLESDGSAKDVGYKGENTAAVYDNNRNEKISYIAPSSFENLADVKLKPKRTSLEKAVKEWLVYLGVANEITTDDQGKIGHTMQINNDLGMNQDLTHVGVGVSQVLPILIMSLLAEKGDVIILEQPELHLHPKVQTRLADFFVAMNALGKQCLIETHSEYLINRLRYFVAKSENSKVADDTMIYFVEKEEGHSKYRPVTINKYGVIEDWPDGFFDESSKIAEAILEAGMNKRMQELGIDE